MKRVAIGAGAALGLPGFLFCSAFAAVGTAIAYRYVVDPYMQYWDAERWTEAECEIIESRVVVESDSESTSYDASIRYRYSIDGSTHAASKVTFNHNEAGARDAEEALVRAHPLGTRLRCWVNPQAPTSAVLHRTLRPRTWLTLLFALPFLAVGYGGIAYVAVSRLRAATKSRGEPIELASYLPALDRFHDVDLESQETAGMSLAALLIINCSWNVGVGFLVVVALSGGLAQGLCMGTFLIPFVVFGSGMFLALMRKLLVLLTPTARVHVDRAVARPGETARGRVVLRQRVLPASEIVLRLQGREQSTYSDVDSEQTDTSVFLDTELLRQQLPVHGVTYDVAVPIPDTAMHTFVTESNSVRWTLVVEARVGSWPTEDHVFELVVAPRDLEVP